MAQRLWVCERCGFRNEGRQHCIGCRGDDAFWTGPVVDAPAGPRRRPWRAAAREACRSMQRRVSTGLTATGAVLTGQSLRVCIAVWRADLGLATLHDVLRSPAGRVAQGVVLASLSAALALVSTWLMAW